MIHLLQTLLLTCFAVTVQAKIFGRCELFHALKVSGLDGYEGYSLANWICMSFFETGFDTEAIDRRKDGTKDYGIFHINNGWWCKDEGTLSENLCSMSCAGEFLPASPPPAAGGTVPEGTGKMVGCCRKWNSLLNAMLEVRNLVLSRCCSSYHQPQPNMGNGEG
ncbi:lysozyme C-like isoform X1 [Zootoca vivipara]|uniref:lysozyme C-like isoform X1 n=1 Tax=Zootoca vivipara TaxID=8524 RepID=UPI0015908571|nr:lysozyme C-like isoform X1 [Zootoca vivipara]